MARAKKRYGNDLGEVIEHYTSRTFGFASKNFYIEFLTAVEVARNYTHYFGPLDISEPLQLDSVVLDRPYHLDHITDIYRDLGYPVIEASAEDGAGLEALKTALTGHTCAFVGQSGVGKSTLLHILGTLDRPSAGRVLFRGEDVFGRSPGDLARLRNQFLGFVFQFHHLLPEFSAIE